MINPSIPMTMSAAVSGIAISKYKLRSSTTSASNPRHSQQELSGAQFTVCVTLFDVEPPYVTSPL
jgi:hypothetical protein